MILIEEASPKNVRATPGGTQATEYMMVAAPARETSGSRPLGPCYSSFKAIATPEAINSRIQASQNKMNSRAGMA